MAVAGHGSVVAAMAGLRLPIEVQALQARVSEPVKPVFDEILVFNGYGCYMMQSDKGELVIGGPTDPYPSCAQRGSFRAIERVTAAVPEMSPIFSRMKLLCADPPHRRSAGVRRVRRRRACPVRGPMDRVGDGRRCPHRPAGVESIA